MNVNCDSAAHFVDWAGADDEEWSTDGVASKATASAMQATISGRWSNKSAPGIISPRRSLYPNPDNITAPPNHNFPMYESLVAETISIHLLRIAIVAQSISKLAAAFRSWWRWVTSTRLTGIIWLTKLLKDQPI